MDTGVDTLKSLIQQLLDHSNKAAEGGDVDGLARAAFITVQVLREQHRRRCLDTEALKEQTNTSKTQLDQSSMHLQNLLYEKQHYFKEIQSCKNFASEFTDQQVDLAPLEEFEVSAPEHIKSTLDGSEHKLMVARLQHEKEQRVQLAAELEALQQEKQQALQRLEQRKERLEDLKGKLVALGQQAKQLQPLLGPPVGLKSAPSDAAACLPTPLYILLAQMAAAQDVLQLPVAVAMADVAERAHMGLVVDRSAEASAAAAADGPEGGSAKRRRSGSTGVDVQDALKVHKREVQLSFLLDPQQQQPAAVLHFVFYPAVKLVGVYSNSKEAQTLLGQVDAQDKGGFGVYELAQHISDASASKYAAKPFRWAQQLAGVDFLATLPDEQAAVLDGLKGYRQQQRAELFIQRFLALLQTKAS